MPGALTCGGCQEPSSFLGVVSGGDGWPQAWGLHVGPAFMLSQGWALQPDTQSHPYVRGLGFLLCQVAGGIQGSGACKGGRRSGRGEPLATSRCGGCSSAVVVVVGALRRKRQVPLRPTTSRLPSEGRGLWACGGDLPLAPQYHHQHRGRPHAVGEGQRASSPGPV